MIYFYFDILFIFIHRMNMLILAPVSNSVLEPYRNPCVPSPCGPNSICQERGNVPSCSCMTNYVGAPPSCRPECTINAECPTLQACIQQKCRDPCQGSCGIEAICTVSRHTPICTCPDGYTGDAFTMCRPKPPRKSCSKKLKMK